MGIDDKIIRSVEIFLRYIMKLNKCGEVPILESQLKFYEEVIDSHQVYEKEIPSAIFARNPYVGEIFKDGALSNKIKRLMALAVALHAGCAECIIGQTKHAVELGATKAEVTEAVLVAAAMGGNTGGSQRWRVFKVLRELGKE